MKNLLKSFLRKSSKINPKSIKNRPKWTKMVPRSASERILEAGRLHEWPRGAPYQVFMLIYVDFGRHFGAFGGPSETKGAPKTARGCEYGDFLAPQGGPEAPKVVF